MSDFWLYDISVLLNKEYLLEIWPMQHYHLERKLNASTRLILFLTIIGYIVTKSLKILMSSIVTIIVIIVLYKTKKKEPKPIESFENHNKYKLEGKNVNESNFTMPTEKNPLMNVLVDEYKYNTDRKMAAPSYEKKVDEEIIEKSKPTYNKIYGNLGDNLTHAQSMRNFYSMPNTSIPNAQKEFAEFCQRKHIKNDSLPYPPPSD